MVKAQRFSITMPPCTLAQVSARQARPEDEQSTDRSSVIARASIAISTLWTLPGVPCARASARGNRGSFSTH